MKNDKTVPLRMCLVCRKMLPKESLIRIVRLPDGKYAVDPKGKAPGRGAYVCKSAECLALCKKKRILNKSFKCEVPEEVYDSLRLTADS